MAKKKEDENKSLVPFLLIIGGAVVVGVAIALGVKDKPKICNENEKTCVGNEIKVCRDNQLIHFDDCVFECRNGQCIEPPVVPFLAVKNGCGAISKFLSDPAVNEWHIGFTLINQGIAGDGWYAIDINGQLGVVTEDIFGLNPNEEFTPDPGIFLRMDPGSILTLRTGHYEVDENGFLIAIRDTTCNLRI